MADKDSSIDPAVAEAMIRELGLDAFVQQMAQLQGSLGKVAEGMQALGDNAQRQNQDTENLAAHILAIEAVLTVVLRQIPVDVGEVRREAQNRVEGMGAADGRTPSLVQQLAENIVARVDE